MLSSNAVLVCEQPARFEYRAEDQLFYIHDPKLGFTRSMPIGSFLSGFEGAAKAILVYHASESAPATSGEVVPFRRAG